MNLYRTLNETEERKFRQWARDNYKGEEINVVWHPVIIHEIGLMVMESYEAQKNQEETKQS